MKGSTPGTKVSHDRIRIKQERQRESRVTLRCERWVVLRLVAGQTEPIAETRHLRGAEEFTASDQEKAERHLYVRESTLHVSSSYTSRRDLSRSRRRTSEFDKNSLATGPHGRETAARSSRQEQDSWQQCMRISGCYLFLSMEWISLI